MKNVVCRLPYSIRVPLYVLAVSVVFMIERFIKLSKVLLFLFTVWAIIAYFWLSLSANSLFFFIN